jgi:hypothetical protein
VTSAPFRLVLALLALAFLQTRSCGFTPDDKKGEGEPCTRTSECEDSLECRGGVCMPIPDAGSEDAGADPDASIDAGDDAGLDGG